MPRIACTAGTLLQLHESIHIKTWNISLTVTTKEPWAAFAGLNTTGDLETLVVIVTVLVCECECECCCQQTAEVNGRRTVC